MAKKVALDTLEFKEKEVDIPFPEGTLSANKATGEEQGKISRWWPVPKRLWISALALVMLITSAGVAYWWIGAKKTASQLSKTGIPPSASLPPGSPTAQVNDFILTLQDDKGKYLVMTCNLTFELSDGQEGIFRQNMVAVRKIVYEILTKTRLASLLDPKSRDGLKVEINRAVSRLTGSTAIKGIYFTKFVVIHS
jgi:flagellar basal body-associated protein FliL